MVEVRVSRLIFWLFSYSIWSRAFAMRILRNVTFYQLTCEVDCLLRPLILLSSKVHCLLLLNLLLLLEVGHKTIVVLIVVPSANPLILVRILSKIFRVSHLILNILPNIFDVWYLIRYALRSLLCMWHILTSLNIILLEIVLIKLHPNSMLSLNLLISLLINFCVLVLLLFIESR